MIAEPRPRADGRCIVCEKPISTVATYGESDAFDTSRCCRIYFGTELDVDVEPVKKSTLSKRLQDAKT